MLGFSYLNQREIDDRELNLSKSLDYFQKVIEIDPNYILINNVIGDNYFFIGHYEKALSYYLKSLVKTEELNRLLLS